MEYFKTPIFGAEVVLRDMVDGDVEAIVNYWHEEDPHFLFSLGVDPEKLLSKEATRHRLQSALVGGPQGGGRAYFVVVSKSRLLAYTNLNFSSEGEAFAHFHVLTRTPRVKAMMYVLFPRIIETFFSRFPLHRIELQTSPHNRNIARLLKRFGLTPRPAVVSAPDGLARPGELNIYELRKADLDAVREAFNVPGPTPARPLRTGRVKL